MDDRRSHQVVLLAHCLLNPNVKVAGTARHAGMQPELMRLLMEQGLGLVQMSCPEAEHLGIKRPLGSDSLEQYDTPAYGQACAALAWEVCRQIERLNKAGVRVMAILGVEGSPSCSVAQVPVLRQGERVLEPGAGLFVQALEAGLSEAGLGVPILGIPESGDAAELAGALSQLDGIIDPRPVPAYDERTSRLGLHPLAGQGGALEQAPRVEEEEDFDERSAMSGMHPLAAPSPAPSPNPPPQAQRAAPAQAAPRPSTAPQTAPPAVHREQDEPVGLRVVDGVLRVKQEGSDPQEIPLGELRLAAIETFGLGGDGPGPLWVLETRSGQKLAFPMGMEGEEAFLAAAQALPGFDDGALVDAVSAVAAGRFICWRG